VLEVPRSADAKATELAEEGNAAAA
jgi:hypothetical protein